MMVQFNLLPDIKLQYIKTQRLRRMILGVSSIVTAASIGLTVILFLTVSVYQKQKLNNLSKDIDKSVKTLQQTQDLNKILTVQNQLNSLQGFHDKKVVASRLTIFLDKVTPANVSINNITVDFMTPKITITGKAGSQTEINTFTDTLKFTGYKQIGQEVSDNDAPRAFSSVVLDAFAKSATGTTYTISATFDPIIFSTIQTDAKDSFGNPISQADAISLIVPNKVTTRSETEKPSALFQPNPSAGGLQ